MNEIKKTYTVRPAVTLDAPSIALIVREAALSEKILNLPLPEIVSRTERAIGMRENGKSYNILVVEDKNGAILAYAVIQWHIALFLPENEGYISELTVKAHSRGQGIGSMLLDELIEIGKTRSCTRISLINSRFRDSYKREFYSNRGWYEREVAANFIYEF